MNEIKSLDDVHPDLHEAWHERAGILEYVDGLSREDAEAAAWVWYNAERENLSRSIAM